MLFAELRFDKDTGTRLTLDKVVLRYQKKLEKAESSFCTNEELVGWAKNARHGSRFQDNDTMFIAVLDEEDDPAQYYTPHVETVVSLTTGPWSGGSTSSSSGGGCSGGGCDGCSC